MSGEDEGGTTFDIICGEKQDKLTELFLQEVLFYSPVKVGQNEDLETSTEQVENCDMDETNVDVLHEETCRSNGSYLKRISRSPDSEESLSRSPGKRRKSSSTGKNRTPNTLRNIMEKHRHSERIRHHSLNERLKSLCQLVPGYTEDSRETKVVMMQHVISYIAFLENSIQFLCAQLGRSPHPNWILLTSNFRQYFQDYFKGIDETDIGDDEVVAATNNIMHSLKASEEKSCYDNRMKVSSPTVDSTTDSVVPVMVPHAEKEVIVLSQDSGVPSSSIAGDDEMWNMSSPQQAENAAETQGQMLMHECGVQGSVSDDADVFFSSSVSAVLEISSSTQDEITFELDAISPNITITHLDYNQSLVSAQNPMESSSVLSRIAHSSSTVEGHIPEMDLKNILHRNKRKQLSPRRSLCEDDDLFGKPFLPSWSDMQQGSSESPCKVRALPYNIRCNHRHPVQRLQATRNKIALEYPSFVSMTTSLADTVRSVVPFSEVPDKLNTKLDLRKTSWMNGFMMFSRMNRRRFIEAHPGVHTSHISKIMGHAWRNMTRDEQAPYKEKAKLCAQELYRAYTSQPEFQTCSPSPATTTSAADAISTTTTTEIPGSD